MTNTTCDPLPIARPDVLTLYKALLCEVHALTLIQHKCWSLPTKTNKAERWFREDLVQCLVQEELKTLNVTTNLATLFIPEEEIPY